MNVTHGLCIQGRGRPVVMRRSQERTEKEQIGQKGKMYEANLICFAGGSVVFLL
jgi:hypothetical protein